MAVQQQSVAFGVVHDRALDIVVYFRFAGGHEAGPHVDALGSKSQGCDQAPAIRHAAGGDDGNRDGVRRSGQQHDEADVVFPRVPSALETVNGYDVDTKLLRCYRMPHAGALVYYLYAVCLERGNMVGWTAARCLDNLDAAVNDGVAVFVVGEHVQRRQESEVDT